MGLPLAAGLTDPITRVFSFGADSVLQAVSQWVASGAAWLLTQVGDVLSSTTRPELGAKWFTSHYAVMAGLAALVVLPLLLVSILQAVARQDLSTLVRVALVQLPLAILLTAVAVALVQTTLAAVDAMSAAVASSAGLDTRNLLSGVAEALGGGAFLAGSPSIPLFVTFLAGLVVAMGAFALWLELVVRTAAIYVAVLFLPLTLTGLVWPVTARWPRRLAETLAALIVAKLVIVAIMSLAAGALSGGRGPTNLAGVVGGAALLLLAAFAPYALLKALPMVEAGAVAHLEGASRQAIRPVTSGLSSITGLLAGAGGAGDGAADIPMAAGSPEPAGMAFLGGRATGGARGEGAPGDLGGYEGGAGGEVGPRTGGGASPRGGPSPEDDAATDEGSTEVDVALGSRLMDAWLRTAGGPARSLERPAHRALPTGEGDDGRHG